MAQTGRQETYQHYADLYRRGNPPGIPEGTLLCSMDAERPLWRVVGKRGGDCFFNTMREANDYINKQGYRIVAGSKKGR